jgi:hypothetical protein
MLKVAPWSLVTSANDFYSTVNRWDLEGSGANTEKIAQSIDRGFEALANAYRCPIAPPTE